MNISSARKAKEFCKVARSDADGTIVRVPGHEGRLYFVKVSPNTSVISITCREKNHSECKGNSSSICYHSLAAVLFLNPGAKLCETASDAENLANLGGTAMVIHSTQSGRGAGVVLKHYENIDEKAERVFSDTEVLEMAKDYLHLFTKVMSKRMLTEDEYERYTNARRQFGILRMNHSMVLNLVREADEHRLEKGKVLLGREDFSEVI